MPYQENGVKFCCLSFPPYKYPSKIFHLLFYCHKRLPKLTSEMKEVILLIHFFLSFLHLFKFPRFFNLFF